MSICRIMLRKIQERSSMMENRISGTGNGQKKQLTGGCTPYVTKRKNGTTC
jgi:hypothetical protein